MLSTLFVSQIFKVILNCVCLGRYILVQVLVEAGGIGCLEPQWQAFVSCCIWKLETKFGFQFLTPELSL